MISLGNNIKISRKKLGLTQEELALQIGVTSQAVSRWESGAGMPDVSMIVPLAQVLSVSTDTLFGLAQTSQDESIYEEIKKHIEQIKSSSSSPAEAALQECEYLYDKVHQNPANYVCACCFVEQTANLSRYVDFENYAKDRWNCFRDTAVRCGTHVIRFCPEKEWIERTHYALAWIYIHERNFICAREHINTLPSISSNRLRESILAQLASFEHGVDGMKEVLRNNLQNFTRALNKEILYAIEDFAWHDDPSYAVTFGLWGINMIHTLSENTDLLPYCRGFTRDIYKYIIHADMRMENYTEAAKHWEALVKDMQHHLEQYQFILNSEDELSKYNRQQLYYMEIYTKEYINTQQQNILNRLKEWHGEEKYKKLLDLLEI